MIREVMTAIDADWKQRFRAPRIFYSTIAPHAPNRGLVFTNLTGSTQFHAWDVLSGELRQLTDTPGGHANFVHLSPDGRWGYYLKDESGTEIGHYVRLPYEGGQPVDITPDLPPYSSFNFSISHSGNRLGFMAAGKDGFRVYVMDVDEGGSLGQPRELYYSQKLAFGPAFSADGETVVVMSGERSDRPLFSLLAFDAASGEQIAELWDGDDNSLEINLASPLPGDPRFVVTTTRTGTETLLIWNPRTGQRTDLDLPGLFGSQAAYDWSPDGSRLLLRTLNQAVQQLYRFDFASGKAVALQAPEGENGPAYFTPDGKEIYSHWNDAAHPSRLVALDAETGALKRTVLAAGDVPPGRRLQSVSFPSSDGQAIQAWLGQPDGEGPFPTILETHGGPAGVQGNGFNPTAQAWIDHGFAFITVNYRGSVTFGREFEQKIYGNPGHWEMEDVVAARDWLVSQGIARPDAIFLTGWSYGGYLTLLGLGKRPNLWAGGMAGIAIADWAIQYEDTADTLRGYQTALFGGTPADKPEQYRVSSPITYAEQVCAPLLIIQGRNDTRTPARPVEMYEAKMKELGKEITVDWYDTGHAGSFTNVELGIANTEKMLKFAVDVLRKSI
jgi:dipeptidyl aminopeptidase/acylaminoacyl peptidase